MGRNLVTGEDEEILKGKPYQQVVMGADGRVLSDDGDAVGAALAVPGGRLGAGGVAAAVRDGGRQAEGEGLAGGLRGADGGADVARGRAPTNRGSRTARRRWTGGGMRRRPSSYGEVTFAGGHAVGQAFALAKMNTAVGHDEAQKRTRFINRAEPGIWLIGLGYQSDVLDVAGELVASTPDVLRRGGLRGAAAGAGGGGEADAREAWLKDRPGDRWLPTKRSQYNPDGLLVGGSRTRHLPLLPLRLPCQIPAPSHAAGEAICTVIVFTLTIRSIWDYFHLRCPSRHPNPDATPSS